MEKTTTINWKLIIMLSTFALIRPILSMLGFTDPVIKISLTIIITIVWIGAVIFTKAGQPLLTLLMVGLGYGILAIVLSGILSPILTGHLQGPLTNPIAIVSVLVTNSLWGLIAGAIATFLSSIMQKQR